MARKYCNPGQTPQAPDNRGWFRGPNPDELTAYEKAKREQQVIRGNNRKAAEARQMMQGFNRGYWVMCWPVMLAFERFRFRLTREFQVQRQA